MGGTSVFGRPQSNGLVATPSPAERGQKDGNIGVGFHTSEPALMRSFDTGAVRSSAEGKIDYDGFLSPLALEGFGLYMLKHQKQADGQLRASDNWQKGIPMAEYVKSMWRHFKAVWSLWRVGFLTRDDDLVAQADIDAMREDIYALYFNVQGFAHEFEKKFGIGKR